MRSFQIPHSLQGKKFSILFLPFLKAEEEFAKVLQKLLTHVICDFHKCN